MAIGLNLFEPFLGTGTILLQRHKSAILPSLKHLLKRLQRVGASVPEKVLRKEEETPSGLDCEDLSCLIALCTSVKEKGWISEVIQVFADGSLIVAEEVCMKVRLRASRSN